MQKFNETTSTIQNCEIGLSISKSQVYRYCWISDLVLETTKAFTRKYKSDSSIQVKISTMG